MQHTESIANLAAALSAAQAEIENASKNAQNPHYKSQYADLAEIINTVRPVLTRHGLAVVQFPGFSDGVVTVETILTHKSGEWVSGVAGTPAPKQDPQGVGSALTYLRRYSLAALCAIAQEDDDGNAARSAPSKHAKKPAKPTNAEVEAVQALWIHAANLGVAEAKPDGMAACDIAIRNREPDKLAKSKAWLEKHIAEADSAKGDAA